MINRENHIAKKKKEIEKIAKQQERLIKKAAAIPPLTQSKRIDVNLRRLGKIIAIGFQIRALEMQKQMIIAQPIPSYVSGGIVPGNIAIAGESGPELIILPNGTFTTANQHPHPHVLPPGPIRPVPGIDLDADI